MTVTDDVVTPERIRAKFGDLQGEIDNTTTSTKSMATTIGTAVVVTLVVAVFFVGLRRGRRNTTVVEIRRV